MNWWQSVAPDSLQERLETRLLVPLLVLFLISGALSYGITRHYVHQVYDRWLYDSANSLAQGVRAIGGRAGLDLPGVAQAIFQWDDDDQTVFHVVGSKSGYIAGIPEMPYEPATPDYFRNARLFDAPLRGKVVRWAAVKVELPSLGEQVTVMIGETTSKRRKLADEILLAVWIPQLLLLLLAGWVTHKIIFFQTHNILTLSEKLRDFSHRTMRPVAAGDTPAELQPLIEALNTVITKLDRAGLHQRAFIANAAHQLRTPLTALKLQAEQARRCESLPAMRESVVELQQSAGRAVHLANQLLLLSRAEPEAQTASSRERTDLYELVFEAACQWVSRALARGMDLGFDETSDHVQAVVDPTLLREAVNNLLDNALKYCSVGTRITVAVRLNRDCRIVVEDNGPGISPAERERVVQRFYRGDRAGADSTEGSGLGLAIVSEIALAHAGHLVISESESGGVRCEIRLPTGND